MNSYLNNGNFINNNFFLNNVSNTDLGENNIMALTFYNASVSGGAGNGVVAGLFIPIADLPMVTAGEFGAGQSQATKESKALLGIGTALLNYYNANTATILGFSVSRTQSSVSDGVVNWQYNFTNQKVAKMVDQSFDVLPLPSTGTYSGIGGIDIDAVFPNAAVVAAESAISGEGLLIPNSMIIGGFSATLAVDKRDYLEGLLTAICDGGVTLRSTSTASGIVALSNPNNYTGLTLAAAATDATNPTTGLTSNDLGLIATVSKTMSYTIQLLLNSSTGVFDVNSVIS